MGIAPPPDCARRGLPLGSAVIRVSMKRHPFNHWARRRQPASDSQRLPADRQLVVAGGLWFVVCGLWFVGIFLELAKPWWFDRLRSPMKKARRSALKVIGRLPV